MEHVSTSTAGDTVIRLASGTGQGVLFSELRQWAAGSPVKARVRLMSRVGRTPARNCVMEYINTGKRCDLCLCFHFVPYAS